ncbi:thiosulfate:cyanide sulfurtransferase [Psychromonas sp. CNPT3]|nr:thiosulfate:cyanide sulfurtransferase [Psychromonas sp. CNPT3]
MGSEGCMQTFKLIEIKEVKQRLKKGEGLLVDIRDSQTFSKDHEQGSFHLSNDSISKFMDEVQFSTPLYVICYHGNSSKGVAQYLCAQGYVEVYSVEKGFQDWRIDSHQG